MVKQNSLGYKNHSVNAACEVIAAWFQHQTKHINSLCEQTAEFQNAKPGII